MTENPASSTEEAAALVKLVTQRRERVREFLQRGGSVDFFIIFFAHLLGSYLSDGKWTTGIGVVRVGLAVVVLALAVMYVRRRRNLGGEVELPTWLAAGAVFVLSILVHVVASGDRAGDLGLAVWGLGSLAIAIAYRRTQLFLFGGAFVIIGIGDALPLPIVAWALPLALYVLVVAYLGRAQLTPVWKKAS